MSPKVLFGGIIVILLLVLYATSVGYAIWIVLSDTSISKFSSGFSLVISTIGGLVSALVISELAITGTGETPGMRLLEQNASVDSQEILKVVTWTYLAIWLLAGLLSFIVGVMIYPDVLADLTTLGKSWLGLAAAAAYSYFALKPR